MRLGLILTAISFSAALISCEKAIEEPQLQKNNVRTLKNIALNTFSYGDNILYLQRSQRRNSVSPVNRPAVDGYFRAIPEGLSIDRSTGVIDLSKSLTGLAFKVFYVSNGGKLVDSTRVVISGIDYEDGIYKIGEKNLARPVYNANLAASIASEDVMFDETDTDEDGLPDVAGINARGLRVDKKTGAIDLAASVSAGIFGSGSPVSGSTRDFSFFYRIKDASNRSLNKIDVKVFYYKTIQEVPASLIELLKKRQALDARINKMPTPGFTSETNLLNSTTDPLSDLDAYGAPRRPPLIIIIG